MQSDRRSTYWVLAIVFASAVGLIVLFHFFPVWHVVSDLAGISAVGSLVGALFQLIRDRIAHERTTQLEERRNQFTVGATSHMASVVFDKHVAFCEEYSKEMLAALRTLFTRGPHEEAIKHASNLADIRTKWAPWVTPELETTLGRFEWAIREVGGNASSLALSSSQKDRQTLVKQMYVRFSEVIGGETWQGEKLSDEVAVTTILKKLRQVLGVEELTQLRTELVKRALENLN